MKHLVRSAVLLAMAAAGSVAWAEEPGMGREWPPSARDISQATQESDQSRQERQYLLRIEKIQEKQADFRRRLKELGLVFRRSCDFHQNMVLDLGYHQLEFLNADGRYAKLKVTYREPFSTDYAPVLTIIGDPAGQEFELKAKSIDDFMAKTDDLGFIKRKIADMTEKVGPSVKAEDGREGCGGEGWQAVPIEVR